ncbi:Transcription factor TFIIIB component B''-like protein [Armadillidium vulgare]|nr:Transcription factor TFIIIB component B''-like protein [Armadillidium vulgare]
MSLMRRNKLRIIPNVARKLVANEKCDSPSSSNLPVKVENETNNNEKESLFSNDKEKSEEISENSPIITPAIDLHPTACEVELDQGRTNDSNLINYSSLNSTVIEKDTNSDTESFGDNNNHTSCNLQSNLPISVQDESLKSVQTVDKSLGLSTHSVDDISFNKKDVDVKTDFKPDSKKKIIKIPSHENSIEETTTDKHVAINTKKEKQLTRAKISVLPKKCNKRLQNSSRGGKENAVLSKSTLSPTRKLNEEDQRSSENNEIKKEKNKSILNPTRKHKPKSLTKSSPYFERKSKFRSKITPSGELEKSKMTMFDLIFWNPTSNPMPQAENDREIVIRNNEGNQNDLTATRIEEQNVEEEGLDITENSENNDKNTQNDDSTQNNNVQEEDLKHASESEEEEPATLAPQVKIGPNGELVVDEKSLLIQTTAAKNRDKVLSTAEVVEEDNNSSHYGKWSKRKKKSTEWTLKETARFYKALSTVGTDFSLMSMILNWRTRAELKIKFKKEEKFNRNLIDMALNDTYLMNQIMTLRKTEKILKKQRRLKQKGGGKKREERKGYKRAKERKLKLEQEKLNKKRKRKLKNVYKKIKSRQIGKEPVETERRKRKLSVTIDPQEVICEVVFASQPLENNCTVQEDVASNDQNLFSQSNTLLTVPVVDVGEDETVTISQTPIISYAENEIEEAIELKSCESLSNNVSDAEDPLSLGTSQSGFAHEIDEPLEELSTEGYKSPSAVHLPIPPSYGNTNENLVLMPSVDPCNPSKQIYHVFKLTKDESTNPDTSCESANALNNNNNNSENVL